MEVELLQYRPPQADVCSTYAILWCYGYFIFHELVKSYRACTQSKKASEKLCGQNGDSFSFWLLNNISIPTMLLSLNWNLNEKTIAI